SDVCSSDLGFGGVGFGRHVHAGAAVEADVVADSAADQLGDWDAVRFAEQVVERNLGTAVDFGQLQVGTGSFQELHAEGVGVGEGTVLEEGGDRLLNDLLGVFAAGSGGVAYQAVVSLHADEHGVALEDGALAAVERQPDRFGKGVGKEVRSDARDFHGRGIRITRALEFYR